MKRNNRSLGFGEDSPKHNPIPEGMERLKFSRNGVNVHKGEDCHWFIWGNATLVLKGHDVNRIQRFVDVYKHEIDGKDVYSEFTKEDTIERLR